jgi:hypothetical protein
MVTFDEAGTFQSRIGRAREARLSGLLAESAKRFPR